GNRYRPGASGRKRTGRYPRCYLSRFSAGSAGPGRLGGGDRHRARGGARQDLPEVALLPLEDEGRRGPVLAQRVELHRTLHGGQRGAAVQVADDLGVVGAPGGDNRLGDDLTY